MNSVSNLTITSNPEGATICIDGSVLTDEFRTPITTPATITLLEGYHNIALELYGYYTGYERIYIYPGIKSNTSTYLAKKMYVSVIESMQENTLGNVTNKLTGNVIMTTYPTGANIYIDGNLAVDTGTMKPITTPVDMCIYMGYHDIRFTLEGYYDEFWGVYVLPREAQYIHRNFNVARSC